MEVANATGEISHQHYGPNQPNHPLTHQKTNQPPTENPNLSQPTDVFVYLLSFDQHRFSGWSGWVWVFSRVLKKNLEKKCTKKKCRKIRWRRKSATKTGGKRGKCSLLVGSSFGSASFVCSCNCCSGFPCCSCSSFPIFPIFPISHHPPTSGCLFGKRIRHSSSAIFILCNIFRRDLPPKTTHTHTTPTCACVCATVCECACA